MIMSLYVGLTVAYYLSAIPIGLALGIGIPAAIEAAQLPPGVRHVLGTAASILLIVSSASFYALDWIGVATDFGLALSYLSF